MSEFFSVSWAWTPQTKVPGSMNDKGSALYKLNSSIYVTLTLQLC